MTDRLAAVVAIPVRNEAQRISACLDALSCQAGLTQLNLGILLFLNNCVDDTSEIVASLASTGSGTLRVVEVVDSNATAGWARRHAMNAAADWLAESGNADGVILTTDADSRVGFDWVKRNLDHVAAGADAVAGRVILEPKEADLLPDSLHARGRLEARYESLLTEIGARLDPDPSNPWPCHWTRSGATLAVRCQAYRAVGGMPDIAHGEDRAFVEALRAAGFIVHHAIDIDVVTSGRLDGRAPGGMADTMRLRCEIPDSPCDDRLERFERALARIVLRRWLRWLHARDRLSSTWLWAPLLWISRRKARILARKRSFDHVYALIEKASPRLDYRPVRPSRLSRDIRRAELFIRALRAIVSLPVAKAPDGRLLFSSDAIAEAQPTAGEPIGPLQVVASASSRIS